MDSSDLGLPKPEPSPPLLWVLGAWAAVGVFSAGPWVEAALEGQRLGARSLLPLVASLLVWAAATPALFRLGARFALGVGRDARNLAIHLACAVALLMAEAALMLWIVPLSGRPAGSYGQSLSRWVFVDLFSYAAVLAAAQAWLYAQRLAAQQRRAAQLGADLLRARFDALQDRLRPHFLFNALNTVSSLVRAQQPTQALQVLSGLGGLLRASLAETEPRIALGRELSILELYLSIERARFGDALQVEVAVPRELWDCAVPPLLLQPLLENALIHGRDQEGRARVQLRASRVGEALHLAVEDQGPGPITPASGLTSGLGLSNTRSRLATLFGPAATLTLQARPGGGAIAEVTLPLHRVAHRDPPRTGSPPHSAAARKLG